MKNNNSIKILFKINFIAAFRRFYGFAFLSLYWGVFAYLFIRYNLSYTSADISAVLSSMAVCAGIFIPMLTLFGEYDTSEVTSADYMPFGIFEKISAKSLSYLAILGIADIPLLIAPLINGYFSVSDYLSSYSFLIVFIAFEIMLLAISQYIALKSKNMIIAAIINYALFIFVFLVGSAKILIPQNAVVSLIGTIILGALVGVIVYAITKKSRAAIIVGAFCAVLPIPFFIFLRYRFEGLLEDIVGALSVFRRLDSFTLGVFDVIALLVFAAIAVSFFLLSLKTFTLKKTGGKGLSKKIRITAVCTSAVLIFSIVASVIPSIFVPLDATQNKKYSISDKTKAFLADLDEDITLYFVDPTSSEETLLAFLNRYVAESSRLDLQTVSTVTDVDVFEKYGINPSSVDSGSIIIASELKHTFLYAGDLFSYTNENIGFTNIDSYTYAQYLYYAYAYDQDSYEILQYETISLFNGDAVITSYIEYLTTDSMPTVFFLNGHGEAEPSAKLLQYLNSFDSPEVYGFVVDELDLSEDTEIPSNAKAIFVNCPQSDISDREYELLSKYLASGGQVTLLTDEQGIELANLTSLLADYGMSIADKSPVESNESTEISVTPAYNHDITALLTQMSTYPVLLKDANSVALDKEAKDSLLLTPLLTYTEKQEDSEESVTYNLAVAAETSDGAKLVLITGADNFDAASEEYSNIYMLICAATWSNVTYESKLGNITPVVYAYPLVEINMASATMFKALFVIVPIVALGLGFVDIIKRKRKDMINK